VTELERAVRLANARLRAFKEVGVPLEGGWRIEGDNPRERTLILNLWCAPCSTPYFVRENPYPRSRVQCDDADEVGAFMALREGVVVKFFNCAHLRALLGPEPPEVAALVPLLLLENPGVGEGR
jgi:hypothetical protein